MGNATKNKHVFLIKVLSGGKKNFKIERDIFGDEIGGVNNLLKVQSMIQNVVMIENEKLSHEFKEVKQNNHTWK